MGNHPNRSRKSRENRMLLRLALKRGWTIRVDGKPVKFKSLPLYEGAPLPMEMTDWLARVEPSKYTVDVPVGTTLEYIVSIQDGTSPYWRGAAFRDAEDAAEHARRNGYQARIIATTI